MAPLLVFLILFIHGATIGLSDDEAYYWVLAQKLSLGYAYHPPGVAGMIAFFQYLLGWLFGSHHPGLVRLPAALSSALILAMSLSWLKSVGLKSTPVRLTLLLLSFFGFFSLSWMMVPDIPLFLGWTLLFTQTWKICFGENQKGGGLGLCAGAGLAILGKYSGVLSIFSCFLALWIWAPKSRLRHSLFCLALGSLGGVLPTVIWNFSHQWASVLYQIRDRHSEGVVSWVRYLRFWGVEALLAGPWVIVHFFRLLSRLWASLRLLGSKERYFKERYTKERYTKESYFLVWILPPALVFCLQPLFSDFKPHWAFIVWWPVVLSLALQAKDHYSKSMKYQSIYGLTLGVFVLVSCHFPLSSWVGKQIHLAGPVDPRMDVTNDFYGWSQIESYLQAKWGEEYKTIPVVGSRYQTAAQAKFNFKEMNVTLMPRDLKEKDEWPTLHVSDLEGPNWPKLTRDVFFVADNRYSASPEFQDSHCDKVGRVETYRFQLLAKWIDVWHCIPTKI